MTAKMSDKTVKFSSPAKRLKQRILKSCHPVYFYVRPTSKTKSASRHSADQVVEHVRTPVHVVHPKSARVHRKLISRKI